MFDQRDFNSGLLINLYQEYTPIVLQYKTFAHYMDNSNYPSPVNNSKLKGPAYRLKITPPDSIGYGVAYVPDPIFVDVPDSGLIRFKLAPTDRLTPRGRYKVEYFKRGRKIPLTTQTWVVPSMPKTAYLNYVVTDEGPIVLPWYVWSVKSLSPGAAFVSEYNTINWLYQAPPQASSLDVAYEPAAELKHLLDYTPQGTALDT